MDAKDQVSEFIDPGRNDPLPESRQDQLVPTELKGQCVGAARKEPVGPGGETGRVEIDGAELKISIVAFALEEEKEKVLHTRTQGMGNNGLIDEFFGLNVLQGLGWIRFGLVLVDLHGAKENKG